MTVRRYMDSPLGKLMLEGLEGILQRITLCAEPTEPAFLPEMLDEAAWQLMQYFDGQQRQFWLPVLPEGTPLQKKVWGELKKIPYGQTVTYDELAQRIGESTHAVAQAAAENPVPVIIPCHRAVAVDGLGAHVWGAEAKGKLLQLEGCQIPE